MSKIIVYPYNWFHQHEGGSGIGGGEKYLERLLNHLKSNHEITIICGCKQEYEHDGIRCLSQGDTINVFTGHNELVRDCDLVITQLIGSAAGYNKAVQHNKPLIFIAHNNSKNYAPRFGAVDKTHIVYNSFQLQGDLFNTFGHFNGTVLHPMIPPNERKSGDKITLINCNHNKGGHLFIEIARQLPQYELLGVFGGYGEQYEGNLPNLTYLPNGVDMERVYADTRVLLVLSEFESFSQVAIEAMSHGIPVIAHPTTGVRENLGDAGIFISRDDLGKYCETIVYLISNPQAWQRQSDVCYERAEWVREKGRLELSSFDKWIEKIK